MGAGSFLFGGPKYDYQPIGGLQNGLAPGLLGKIEDFNPEEYGRVFNKGRYLKGAQQDYKDLRAGKDISGIAGFSGTLGAINNAFASGDKIRNRDADMNLALRNQPQLAAAQKQVLQNDSNQNRANTIGSAASGFYDQTQNFGQRALENLKNLRLQGAGLKLGADENALSQYLGAFRAPTGQSQGFLGSLGNIAGSFLGDPEAGSQFSNLFGGGYRNNSRFDYAGAQHG